MRIIKYITLALVLLNLPSIGLFAYGGGVGAMLSYATIFMLVVYYALEKKTTPNWWIIIIALLYFMIGALQYEGAPMAFMMELIKYFIFVIGGYELAKNTSTLELFVFFLIGALSVGVEAMSFTNDYGRYAGFYLNANVAGFICIYGYSIIYGLKSSTLKLLGQFVFTLMGLLTFSRTFIVIWLLLNLISLKVSIKNVRIFGIAFLIFSTLLFIDQVVGLNNPRFEQLKSLVSDDQKVSSEEISEDSRTETWAQFYDQIFESPIIGSGYGTFSGKINSMGVHNSYLMIIGEAGIIPFLLFLVYMARLFFKSFMHFKKAPYLIMMTISLAVFLLANHNFFTFYYMTFAAMWIQYQIYKIDNEEEELEEEKLIEA